MFVGNCRSLQVQDVYINSCAVLRAADESKASNSNSKKAACSEPRSKKRTTKRFSYDRYEINSTTRDCLEEILLGIFLISIKQVLISFHIDGSASICPCLLTYFVSGYFFHPFNV